VTLTDLGDGGVYGGLLFLSLWVEDHVELAVVLHVLGRLEVLGARTVVQALVESELGVQNHLQSTPKSQHPEEWDHVFYIQHQVIRMTICEKTILTAGPANPMRACATAIRTSACMA
jgi:hypothetical protein